MRILASTFLLCVMAMLGAADIRAQDLPRISTSAHGSQLIVGGKPYLALAGEIGNSSSGTAQQADTVLPRLAQLHVNTALIPVAWEQIEPQEGTYDFSILDHWIEVSRQQQMHLVLLWFGSWKNAFSNYAPAWVKRDTKRFPRAISADGDETEILSTLGAETLRCDSRAFAALLRHVKEFDEKQQTVLIVQVENEVGFLGAGRDRSAEANQLFRGPVPRELMKRLVERRLALSPELASNFHSEGKTWKEAFGDGADEVFMAWHYAKYIETVAKAGKQVYPLPMYVNAQLPAPAERAGEYPSGGPHPYYLEVYRAAAPSIDFYSPDIYWPNFEYWVQRYNNSGNAIFVPESRLETAAFNALYAYGEAKAFGFAAFGIDSIAIPADRAAPMPDIEQTFGVLADLSNELIRAQATGQTRGLVLHVTSPRPTQTVALGGYLFEITLSRSWPAKTLLTDDGAMLLIQTAPDEFFVAGRGLVVTFRRDPDVDERNAGIASIEEVARQGESWVTQRRLNGDQSNQGRQLSMSPTQMRIYRVVLYSTERERRMP